MHGSITDRSFSRKLCLKIHFILSSQYHSNFYIPLLEDYSYDSNGFFKAAITNQIATSRNLFDLICESSFPGSDSKRSASGKGKGKGTKRSPSPAEVPVPQPAPPAGDGETAGAPEPPPPAQPGDDDWECVKEPVDLVCKLWRYLSVTS